MRNQVAFLFEPLTAKYRQNGKKGVLLLGQIFYKVK